MESSTPALSVENVTAGYGGVKVLHDVSLDLTPHEITVLLGTNGNGKSTLLKCIMGLVRPVSGRILLRLDGREAVLSETEPEEMVNLGISLIPEGRKLFPQLTVRENALMGAYRKEARQKVKENLRRIYELFPRLEERQKQLAGTLSGGEQQMLAIGRALMSDPKILLLDELSLGLSPLIIGEAMKIVKRLRDEQGLTILLADQNFTQAAKIADRGYVLVHGQIAFQGRIGELVTNETVKKLYLTF